MQRLLGGTDVPRIIGIAPYGGPIDVYRRVVEGFQPEATAAMTRGLRLEPVTRAVYVDETGAQLESHPGYLKSTRYPFMGASVDDLAKRDGEKLVVEYKTAGFQMRNQWGESGSDQVPDHYRVQVAWYLAATGRSVGDLAVLIAGDDFRCYRITRDLELESMLLEAAERFWVDHVLPQKPPPPDASPTYEEWLQSRYPSSRGEMRSAGPEAERWARVYEEAKLAREAAEEREQEARNHLIAEIADFDGLQGDGWKVTYRQTKGRASVDWPAVRQACSIPDDVIAQHTDRKPYRVFRATFKTEEK